MMNTNRVTAHLVSAEKSRWPERRDLIHATIFLDGALKGEVTLTKKLKPFRLDDWASRPVKEWLVALDQPETMDERFEALIDAVRTAAQLAEIARSISRAQDRWVGCDWTHEAASNEAGEPIYCDGERGCGYCGRVAAAAEAASDCGERAAELLRGGNLAEAIRFLRKARDLEGAWGDSPCWGEPLELAEALADHE